MIRRIGGVTIVAIMKGVREEIGTEVYIVGKTIRIKLAGHMVIMIERMPKKIRDKETRSLQKIRKTTAKMGGLSEERPENGRGKRQVERKGQQHRIMENKKVRCYHWMSRLDENTYMRRPRPQRCSYEYSLVRPDATR